MKWLTNRYVQVVLALIIGISIGVLFYPTKSIEERIHREVSQEYEKRFEEYQEEWQKVVSSASELNLKLLKWKAEYIKETETKLTSLTTENHSLKQPIKKRKFKLIKPDGTIIEKEYEESETEETSSIITEVRREFNEKVEQIEQKWTKAYSERLTKIKTEYDKKITKLEEERDERYSKEDIEKLVTVNKKSFHPEIGITKDEDMYFHMSYDLWGPWFIGGHLEGNKKLLKSAGVGAGFSL